MVDIPFNINRDQLNVHLAVVVVFQIVKKIAQLYVETPAPAKQVKPLRHLVTAAEGVAMERVIIRVRTVVKDALVLVQGHALENALDVMGLVHQHAWDAAVVQDVQRLVKETVLADALTNATAHVE